jgi:uncharacterized protein
MKIRILQERANGPGERRPAESLLPILQFKSTAQSHPATQPAMSSAPLIILFAKAPVPGKVKTRLTPPLSPEQAAGLHRAMVTDTLEALVTLGEAELQLHTDIPTDAWASCGVAGKLQHSGDLGQRMLVALAHGLEQGHPAVMIVGADAPGIPCEHFQTILASGSDVTLGPCPDGGYYAIACRRWHPEMFRGVSWSSSQTLELTEAALRLCGLTTARGPLHHDVDTPADLQRLLRSLTIPPHTRRWLASHSLLPEENEPRRHSG